MLPIGITLQGGKYKIERFLGAGSFGITYLATTRVKTQAAISGSLGHLVQDREVEVKVCVKEFFMKDVNSRGEDGSSVEGTSNTLYTNYKKRFRKEAENLSRLEHSNIVKVLEVFDENGTTYYVMQFIEGETLDDYIKHQRQGHLEEDEARGVVLVVAQALQYMHGKRMLHLDLKPKNIMRGTDGTEYIIDFGLSKQYDKNGEPESSTAIGFGTPGYAPTEQADYIPDGTFPATLDIYALGATLYKMLTGKTPPSANEVLNNGLPARPAHVSTAMWDVVKQAMQPLQRKRYQSVRQILDALKNTQKKDDERTCLSNIPTNKRFQKRHWERKKMMLFLYTVLGFVCVVSLLGACYMPGVENNILGDTWGFNARRSIHLFKIDWIIKSYVAFGWLGLLFGYFFSFFKLNGGVCDYINWGKDFSNPGMLSFIAFVGSGLLIKTFFYANNRPLGDGFWFMLIVIIIQFVVAYRLWKLRDGNE